MDNEELQAELEQARAEVERLQETLADREARVAHAEEQLAAQRDELERARGEAEARERELTGRADELTASVRGAAQRYRELALERSPELPAELVVGETVDEVEESLQRARETVAKVRGHIESQAQAGRVPVGAPPRSAPDLSRLSTEEKIRQGLGG
jgi:chromosome segregation ATPase